MSPFQPGVKLRDCSHRVTLVTPRAVTECSRQDLSRPVQLTENLASVETVARGPSDSSSPVSHIFYNASIKPAHQRASKEENLISQVEKYSQECPAVKLISFQICGIVLENVICGLPLLCEYMLLNSWLDSGM